MFKSEEGTFVHIFNQITSVQEPCFGSNRSAPVHTGLFQSETGTVSEKNTALVFNSAGTGTGPENPERIQPLALELHVAI